MQQKRFLLFITLVVVLFVAWYGIGRLVFPPKEKPPEPEPSKPLRDGALHLALGLTDMDMVRDQVKKQVKETKPWRERDSFNLALGPWGNDQVIKLNNMAARAQRKEVPLGSLDPTSKYHLHVVLTSHGGGVLSIHLNKFKTASEETGKPLPEILELVSRKANEVSPAFLMYHFTGDDAKDDTANARPVTSLALDEWTPSEITTDTLEDGRSRQTVNFTSTKVDGVIVTKTFTLVEQEYHIGLEVKIRRAPGASGPLKFRYQLAGPLGLPIEGRWYTGTFRNALIGRANAKGNVQRDLQESAKIGLWGGGNVMLREEDLLIRYAGVADQYFASVIVVDRQPKENFLTRARPTLEKGLVKGKVESVSDDGRSLTIAVSDTVKETFYYPDVAETKIIPAVGKRVAVFFHTDPQYRLGKGGEPRSLITKIEMEEIDRFHETWEDDITVRVATEPLEVADDKEVVHKYLLYNGPVKPKLLAYVPKDQGVVPESIINRYDDLGLYTMTDYHSQNAFGRFANAIYWTDLLIFCTNVMHRVLYWINLIIPNYGLSIICLTILVRGMMFPISRKGAMMSIKMQELAPEMKKIAEKFKDDPHQRAMAQWDLQRKHGVSPLGTCWFILLQMPIFMGLYYALQESITFRLGTFWPTWIENLAAPDMLISWTDKIPWISAPESYGGFLYLGPYLNILPIIAVALMIGQQKMMTPPPTDEQQEMQQKMMKYMMVFMGLMFYKVAAGLCVYFIASSVWGFAERKLLPKKKPAPVTTGDALLGQMLDGAAKADGSTAVTPEAAGKARQGRGKRGKERAQPEPAEGGSVFARMRRWWRNKREALSEWWAEVLKEASKKQR
jgi:YidC/Oxa1 family membrane protein insertase